ncbi:MAG: hypothetical protein AUH85_13770 [Chloroflexi bacterium 13_1_40CM_4_68_4]|nr:MAG: hypothetical protein AUH85_13770 [Chloroflexi bacterium 13_1_40CM_4_68_4]
MRVLVAEDELETAHAIAELLSDDDHTVRIAGDGRATLQMFAEFVPDLVVLDLVLPRLDGMSVCRAIRPMSHVPILVVSARSSTFDRVIALRSGIDDYLVKPFDADELRARVSALLRRAARTHRWQHTCVGDLDVDQRLLTATVHGRDLQLTPAQFRIVSELAMSRDLVVPVQRLAAASGTRLEGRGVAVHVARIRRKLATAGASNVAIETARGFGYRFVEVQASAAA